MSLLTHLRHVDLAVPDYDKQLDFYTGVWGLTPTETDSGLSFLAAAGSPERYIIRLRRAAEKRLDLVSFGAADPAAVDTLAEQLLAGGVQLITRPGTRGEEGEDRCDRDASRDDRADDPDQCAYPAAAVHFGCVLQFGENGLEEAGHEPDGQRQRASTPTTC